MLIPVSQSLWFKMYNQYDDEPVLNRPFDEVSELKRRKQFSTREVGLNHPDNHSFIRVTDSGEIEIFGGPGIGIVINPGTRSISFFADSVKFYTKEEDGIRWNNKSFNPASDKYNEPALVKTNDFSNNPAYFRTDYYLNNLDNIQSEDDNNAITIMGNYGLGSNSISDNISVEKPAILTAEQEKLLTNYAKTHSDREVLVVRELLEFGYSFSEAVQKVKDGDFNRPDNLEDFLYIRTDLEDFPHNVDDLE